MHEQMGSEEVFRYKILSASNEWAWSVLLNPTSYLPYYVDYAQTQILAQIKLQKVYLHFCQVISPDLYEEHENFLSDILMGKFHLNEINYLEEED